MLSTMVAVLVVSLHRDSGYCVAAIGPERREALWPILFHPIAVTAEGTVSEKIRVMAHIEPIDSSTTAKNTKV